MTVAHGVAAACLVSLLVAGLSMAGTAAAEYELRAPQSEFTLEIDPEDPAVDLRVYWSCYRGDLADAAQSVVERHNACWAENGSSNAPHPNPDALAISLGFV